jgi:uncharacterized membrane protein YdjX (TVP38/TMEM64 family)
MTKARIAIVGLFAAIVAAAVVLGVPGWLSWAGLAAHQTALRDFAARYPAGAAAAYLAIYCAVVALSVPGGGVLTIAGGLMFGPWRGAVFAVIGASSGAVLLFLLARSVLAAPLARRLGGFAERLRDGLAQDGFNYLLALRLVPVVPFWLVNLAPALLGMRLLPYAGATVLGIIPASVVFAGVGASLGDVLAAGHAPDSGLLFSPRFLLPLLGLAALALLPALWRRRKMFFA